MSHHQYQPSRCRIPKKTALSFCVAAALSPLSLQAADSKNAALEEVIITAERRAVSVQDMPLSAVALSGSSLEKRGVNTFEQLQYQVPSLTFTDNGNTKYVNIRGVGVSESAPNQTVGVAVHLDGAYVAREFVYGDAFFDLESVEVLRGPQGTYSGQNASGGAIFINSRKPTLDETNGFINFEYGNYDYRRTSAGVSFPLSDTLAARISGDWAERDSFYDNHGPDLSTPASRQNHQPGNVDRSFGRFQLLYQPNDDLEIRFVHEVSDNKTDGVPYQFFASPGSNELPSDPWDLNYDMDGHRSTEYERSTVLFDWAATEAFRVVGNLSTLESDQHYLQDGDRGSPLTDPEAVQSGSDYRIQDDYWTAEVSLVSQGDGPLEWTVGGSYLDYQQDNYLNFLRYNHPSYPGTGLDPTIHTRLYFYMDNVRKNQAVFGEIGYDITPELQIKVGLRYNEDEVGFGRSSYLSAGPAPAGRLSHYNAPSGRSLPAQDLLKFDAMTGRILVNWQPDDDNLYYFTISRGYKPGGTTPFANEYDEEEVTNYEAGWKGTLMEDSLNVAISAYHMEYDAFQRTYSPDPDNPAAQITRNVDGSTITGVEVQLSGMVQQFRWDLSFSFNDGEYGDLDIVLPIGVIDGTNPTSFGSDNLSGEPIDYLPEFVYNFGLSYEGFEFAGGRLIPSIRVSHQDEYYTTFYHYDYNLIPSKTLVDAFINYESEKDWSLQIFAKNLTDKEYISRANGGDDGIGEYLMGNPREVGVKLTYNF